MGVLDSNKITKTNFSAIDQTLELNVANLNTVRFEFVGTYNFVSQFEALGIDDVTWYPLQTAQVDAPLITTSHSAANATRAYKANCSAVAKVRIRLSAFTSAGAHSVGIAATESAVDPAPVTVIGAGAAQIGIVNTPLGTTMSVVTTASTNSSVQKSTAGNLFELLLSNPTATSVAVKLYNKATAPTVGTDVPVVTQVVPAGQTVQFVFGRIGKRFATGIGIAATALPAATDTGVAVAGVQIHGSYI